MGVCLGSLLERKGLEFCFEELDVVILGFRVVGGSKVWV